MTQAPSSELSAHSLELAVKIVGPLISVGAVNPTDADVEVAVRRFAGMFDHMMAERGEPAMRPAVPIEESVQPDYLVCLEDGKRLKLLKRHLRAHYGLTPEAYRRKWGLPPDYPMAAPNYSKSRSEMARKTGLGRRRSAPTG